MQINKEELRASLEDGLRRYRVPGASVAVFNRGEVTAVAAGITNVTTGVELTPETVMHIGSITKVFTATLVLQLVDEDKVNLDEPVLRYLPDLRLKDRQALEKITVKMLLNHTSGIDGSLLADYGHDEETLEKGVMRIAECGQLFSPGADFSYCNAGMVIAGYLAQRLRGASWYRLVRERIFEPLEMEHAATLPEEALLHRASVGHYLRSASDQMPMRTPIAFKHLSFAPAGTTLMTSAAALIAFARAHMALGVGANGKRILSAGSAQAMQQMTVRNSGRGYTAGLDIGLGWMISGDRMLHHAGGGPGIATALYACPDREFAVACLTNAEYSLGMVGELLEPWLKEVGNTRCLGMVDVRIPPEPIKVDGDKYVGVYEERIGRFQVLQTANGLAISWQTGVPQLTRQYFDATRAVALIPLGNEEFVLGEEGDYRLPSSSRFFTFRTPGADGRMQHLGNVARLFKRVS